MTVGSASASLAAAIARSVPREWACPRDLPVRSARPARTTSARASSALTLVLRPGRGSRSLRSEGESPPAPSSAIIGLLAAAPAVIFQNRRMYSDDGSDSSERDEERMVQVDT